MASNNYINECKNRANGNRLGKIIIGTNEITNSDNLQKISIDSGCYIDGAIIGSVYSKMLKANFISTPKNIELANQVIQAQIGVKYANNTTEYINMGKYTIERPKDEITANMQEITAYDDSYNNINKPYVCNIDYSQGNKTLKDLYVDVCNQLNLIPKTLNFLNNNIPISNNPFTNNETNRTVLSTIAKISCSYIDIDNDTLKIDLCWLSQSQTPDYTFELNDYANVEGGQITYGPINCLVIKNSQIDDENVTRQDDASIMQYGEHKIVISEDYILYNEQLRQQAINAIWNRVHNLKYVDCKLTTYYGKPFLKLGNKIRVYTSSDEYFDTYVLKHNFTYDGTFESIIESPSQTDQEIKTKQDISLGQALKNTQIEVNKQKQKISAVVETVQDAEKTVNELKTVEQSAHDNPILIENASDNYLKELSIEGNSYQENEPTPQNPSEIISVNGYINLFDNTKDFVKEKTNITKQEIETGVRIIVNNSSSTVYNDILVGDITPYLGKTLTLSCIATPSATNKAMVQISRVSPDGSTRASLVGSGAFENGYMKISATLPDSISDNNTLLCVMFAGNYSGVGAAGNYIDYTNVLLTETDVEYEPYSSWIQLKNVGKNQCPTNFLKWESGQYGATGNKQASASRIRLTDLVFVKPSEKYYFNTFSNSVYSFIVRTYKSDKTFLRSIGARADGSYITLNDDEYYLGISIYNPNDTTLTFDNYRTLFENETIKPFICLLSIKENERTYEKYKERKVNFKLNKENLFKIDNITESKYINSSGNLATNSNYNVSDYIDIENYENITYFGLNTVGNTYLAFYNENKERISLIKDETGAHTIEVPTNSKYVRFTINDNSLDTFTVFEGYESEQNTVFRKVDDYADELEVDMTTGDYYKIQKIKKVVLDGSETIAINTSLTNTTSVYLNNFLTESSLFANKFNCNRFSFNQVWNKDEEGMYLDDKSIIFRANKSTIGTTSNEVKAWLSSNNVEINYILSEPQKTYLGKLTKKELENLKTFKGYNNISAEDIPLPNIKLTYYTDNILNETFPTNTEQKASLSIETGKIQTQVYEKIESTRKDLSKDINDFQSDVTKNYLTTEEFNSQINVVKDSITSEVSKNYVTQKDNKKLIDKEYTKVSQKLDKYTIEIGSLSEKIDKNNKNATDQIDEIKTYFDFSQDGLQIGKSTSDMKMVAQNDRLSFKQGTKEKAYMSSDSFVLKELTAFQIGDFIFQPRENGSLDFKKVGS